MSTIKDLQLSRSTVTRRFEEMEENLAAELERDIGRCECFSIQFDESTDCGYRALVRFHKDGV